MIEAIPDAIEPIRAWRYWRVGPSGLTSFNRTVWDRMELDAECTKGFSKRGLTIVSFGDKPIPAESAVERHSAPHEDCRCGIYGAKDLDTLKSITCPPENVFVVGEVDLYGKVIPGKMGYRAEKARIVSLYGVNLEAFTFLALENYYGIPVGVMDYSDACDPQAVMGRQGTAFVRIAANSGELRKSFEESMRKVMTLTSSPSVEDASASLKRFAKDMRRRRRHERIEVAVRTLAFVGLVALAGALVWRMG